MRGHGPDFSRRAGFALARAAIDGPRFRRLLLDCAFWLLDGDWRNDGDQLRRMLRQRPARAFAQDELQRRTRKIIKRVRKLEQLDARRRHKLRIAVKKLRYGREFFASLTLDGSHGKAGRKVDHALKRLQGALGDLNDMRAHAQRAQGFARANTASRKAFAAGVLIGATMRLQVRSLAKRLKREGACDALLSRPCARDGCAASMRAGAAIH